MRGDGGGFIVNVDGVPLTRTTFERLKLLSKTRGLSYEAMIGYAAERYMEDHGEQELRVDAAKLALAIARRKVDV